VRGWHETVALLGDVIPVPVLALILLAGTAIVALLWYWWPEWLPGGRGGRTGGRRWRWPRWRWPRFGAPRWSRWRWRWRWRRRRRGAPEPDLELRADELPDIPAAALLLTADELAARGRYREAVRERLRAIVRDLVERDVIENRLGWTVTELARMAAGARPATARPLAAASDIFSEIWYGQRPALAADDAAMREHAAAVRAALELRAGAGR